MGERTRYAPGTPSWVDVTSPDPRSTAAFYRGLVGWELDATSGLPGGGSFRLDGRRVAGLVPGDQARWRTFVTVRDVARIVQVAEVGGATVVVPPTTLGDAGTLALFTDPAGAPLGVWQPGLVDGAQLVNEPGTWCWNELTTPDPRAAPSFYTALLSWQPEPDRADDRSTLWMLGDRAVAGMRRMDDSVPAGSPAWWRVDLAVGDLDDALGRVVALGGTVLQPPVVRPGSELAIVADPVGASFGLLRADELDD